VVATPRELCEDCAKSYGNGCPIWPPIKLTLECIEFELIVPREKSK